MTKEDTEIIASPDFPAYCLSLVSDRYVIIGGGGGAAKTGIKNKIDIYELHHNGQHMSTEKLVSYEVGESCVSNLAAWSSKAKSKKMPLAPPIMAALGLDEKCSIFSLSPNLVKTTPVNSSKTNKKEDKTNKGRKRGGGAETKKDTTTTNTEETTSEPSISYNVQRLKDTQTVQKAKEGDDFYQKCVRVSSDHSLLATGGTDGHIRLWRLPDMTQACDIAAHAKDVDDLDFRHDSKQIISVSKPSRQCIVWNVKDGKEVAQLAFPVNGIKYKFYRARYGISASNNSSCLFTISNPMSGSKPPSLVVKWCGREYTQQCRSELRGTLSSLAVSETGMYVAAGTMAGSIFIMTGYKLQTIKIIEKAHGMFVTGLEWLPLKSSTSKMVRGFSEAAVLSISCDNTVKVHHIPRRGAIPIWLVIVMVIITLLFTFISLSVLGV